jgi:5-methylcytosine-specific restriction endonuclease McrA
MRKKTSKKQISDTDLRNALRRVWMYSKERSEALLRAETGDKEKIGRVSKKVYKCEKCGKNTVHPEVDHIIACGSIKEVGWDTWIERLRVSPEGLIILCIPCHDKKKELSKVLKEL